MEWVKGESEKQEQSGPIKKRILEAMQREYESQISALGKMQYQLMELQMGLDFTVQKIFGLKQEMEKENKGRIAAP